MIKKETKKIEQKEINKDRPQYKKSSIYISLNARIIFWLIISIILIVAGISLLFSGLNNFTTYNFFYSENSTLDYKVCLKENDYFKDTCLDKNKQYIASLIDYIETDFKYNFNSSDLFNYKYKYYITATLIATEKNNSNKILYENEERITDEKSADMKDSNGFTLKENLKIDYKKYNDIMTSFRKDYTLLLDSKIIITLHVKLDGNYSKIESDIITNQKISMSIPLTEQTIDIMMDYNDLNNSDVIKNESNNNLINILFYVLSGICFLISLLSLGKLFKILSKVTLKKSVYEKKLNKIMKEYDQVIVKSKKVPDLARVKIFEIESFEELLDVRNTLQKPILFIKIHNEKSVFLITNGNEYYRYIMKAVDLDKEIK